MNFLAAERRTLRKFLPGLDEQLAEMPLLTAESPGSGAIELFRKAGGPGLLIPTKYSGLGASALDVVRVQRAIGSRSPSLAVATTMHNFSVASVVEVCAGGTQMEWILLQAIAKQRLLVASGFAEGETGRSILKPSMEARKIPGGALVSGSKKPCSLSSSMNLLTASVVVRDGAGDDGRFAVVIIPAESKGIERRPFWKSFVLAGAESDELFLSDVFVPDRLIFKGGDGIQSEKKESRGFLWFELLVSASYLGAASALVERVIAAEKGTHIQRSSLATELEASMAALERVAYSLMTQQQEPEDFGRALFVRYAVQGAIERATASAAELLGGMAFVQSSDVGYLYAAARALSYHPPSRLAASRGLADYMAGHELNLG